MVYLVTREQSLFTNEYYKRITIEESLQMLSKCKKIQFDTETSGRDPHICNLLCVQFGSREFDFQIVVDTSTVSVLEYKEVLTTKLIIGQNLKFDLQFLYNYGIVPLYVYDTMIVEQLLYLGWSSNPAKPNFISCSLSAIADRRLNIDIDKSIRSQIIWRGLDTEVILYAALSAGAET